MKRSKRYRAALALIEQGKVYSAQEAVEVIKKVATDDKVKTKFTQGIEASFHLNLKASHSVRDMISLPHSVKKGDLRILVFARGDIAKAAEEAGATFVGDDELIAKVKGGWVDFDVAISTPDLMKEVGKLGPVLGRRGLMPNPKTGTVTTNVVDAINEFKKGKLEFRADKAGVVNLPIASASFDATQIMDNLKALYGELQKKKPSDVKGAYIKSAHLTSTMGPSVPIALASL